MPLTPCRGAAPNAMFKSGMVGAVLLGTGPRVVCGPRSLMPQLHHNLAMLWATFFYHEVYLGHRSAESCDVW